jgi:hypothetical protein
MRMIEIKDEILRVASTLNLEETTTLPKFVSTICGGLFAESFHPAQSALPTLAHCVDCFHELQSGGVSPDAVQFMNMAINDTPNRSLFITVDGRICLGPRSVRVGDVVAVFLGCATPPVLRPNGLGQFKLIGEAYCYGLMQGEALLRPLDNMWKQAWRLREGFAAYDTVFINKETREISVLDPRLGRLPSGWNCHCEKGRRWYYWPDGAKNMTTFDPRLTPESLTKRGVEVRDFEIV